MQIKTNITNYDTKLIVYYILLVVIGWFVIYTSAHDNNATSDIFSINKPYIRQLIWIGVSLFEVMVILLINQKLIFSYAYYFYGFCLLIMISVLFIGSNISGAQAWIKIGSLTIQPVEFMKLGTSLALSKFFANIKTIQERKNIWIYASLFIAVAVILTLLQHDTGSALVFFSFMILFYREGLSSKLFFIGIMAVFIFIFTLLFNEIYCIAILLTIFLVSWYFQRKNKKKLLRNVYILIASIVFVFAVNVLYNNVLQSHQKQRIDTILGKSSDPQGTDFNYNQSLIAIGSGGFWGKGIHGNTQTQLNFVPEQSTDFIFCCIAETFGFVGSIVLFVLFMLLIVRIIKVSEKQQNAFIRYYGYSIAGILFFHFAINIGMTIGILPIIGIPLPFISYGGSSILAFTAMLFIFIKLSKKLNV